MREHRRASTCVSRSCGEEEARLLVPVPKPLTITVDTSPSLADRFHSSTLKCLNTLMKGCCQTGRECRLEDTHRRQRLCQVPHPLLALAEGIPLSGLKAVQ